MPKFSRETAPEVIEFPIGKDLTARFDHLTYQFTSFTADADGVPLLKGLPGDMCNCPHHGYVFEGTVRFTYADGSVDEIGPGEAYHVPAGHVPFFSAGSELLMISPTAELKITEDHMIARMQELAGG